MVNKLRTELTARQKKVLEVDIPQPSGNLEKSSTLPALRLFINIFSAWRKKDM